MASSLKSGPAQLWSVHPPPMFLRRLSSSAIGALRRGGGANDGGVLAAVQAELAHELSSGSPSLPSQGVPGFETVSDALRAQDVLLRRRHGGAETESESESEEEEVTVSALLSPLRYSEDGEPLPRDTLMKVFVSKPGGGARPVLRFDCRTVGGGRGGAADYRVTAACYHSFPGEAGDNKYEAPEFSDLDLKLQDALKKYLQARGINSKLAGSLNRHLIEKERVQYVSWLKTLEGMFTKDH